jgi:general stress protein 26
MNTIADINFDPNSFDIEDSEDVIGLAKSLINGRHPGILSTVDGDNKPHLRWMSTLSFADFPVFHTLTSPASRKVSEIQANPNVNWMFFNADMSLVINLSGTAKVIEDKSKLEKTWDQIVDVSHAYFLNQYDNTLGFVVIETHVDFIECNSPKNSLRFSVKPRELTSNH